MRLTDWAIRGICVSALTLSLFSGCDQVANLVGSDKHDDEVEVVPTEEQIETLSKAIADAEDAIAMFKETNSGIRLQSFDIASKRGLEVADQLLEASEPGSDEFVHASFAKARLLRHRASFRADQEAKEALTEFVEQVQEQHAEDRVVPYVKGQQIALKYIDEGRPFREAFGHLRKFSQDFPGAETPGKLMVEYTAALYETGALDKAKYCYKAARRLCRDDPELISLGQQLESEFRARAAKMAQTRRNAAGVSRFASQHLGGQVNGYFILFSQKASGEGRNGNPCSYVVVHGAEGVASHADNMDKMQWVWEVQGKYADTEKGRQQAYAEANKLKRKNTTTMPIFR